MTAPLAASLLAAARRDAIPVAFDGLLGWLLPGVTRRGVVLCGAQGYEALSAYRAWRGLAERIGGAGCAALRFDWPGEGDSTDGGAADLAAWTAGIRGAVRTLRERADVAEVVLVGLRLGGTVAALAAAEAGADRLVLLAPFATGRACLREMGLQARSIGRLADGSPLPRAPGDLSVGGFRLDPALAEALGGIDLAAAETAPAPRILLVGGPKALAERYRALGASVETAAFPGLAALLANPLLAETPAEAFGAAFAFAVDDPRPALPGFLPVPAPARLAGPGWREEALRFGPGLAGTLCRPEAAPRRAAVLFLNAGLNVRSGWGRGTTTLARALAAEGVASLRIDLAGIGDSPERPDAALPLYSLDPLPEVAVALDRLEAEDLGPVVLVGACSGAHLGFNAATRDRRVRGALLVNLYRFDWHAGDSLEVVMRGGTRSVATYGGLLARPETWRRALRGEIRVGVIAAALARRVRGQLARAVARRMRPGGTVPERIAAFRARGGAIRLVYSEGDAGLVEAREHLGAPARAARVLGAPVATIPDADHDLSPPAARARLAAILREVVAEAERGA